MKYLFTAFILIIGSSVFAQIEQNVNKTTGTESNPINEIDSIRFNGSLTEMQIILNNGSEVIHIIEDIVNVTFSGQASGQISGLDCGNATISGTLISGIAASGVSAGIDYTGGNGGAHNGQTIASMGITGLTAELAAGNFDDGAGTLTYDITGLPTSGGTASFAIEIGGELCTLNIVVHGGEVLPSCGPVVTGNSVCTEITTPPWQTTPCEAVPDFNSFGRGLATNGRCLAVTYLKPNFQESVALFIENEDLQWEQIEPTIDYPESSPTLPDFGAFKSMAFSGDFLFIGARKASSSGRVYVYQKDASGIYPSEPTQILEANPTHSGSAFGYSLDAKGNYLIVGSPLKIGSGNNTSNENEVGAGAAYIFFYNGDSWVQEKHWENPIDYNRALMGYSVAIDIADDGVVTAFAGAPENMENEEGEFDQCPCPQHPWLLPTEPSYFFPYGAVKIIEKIGGAWPANEQTVTLYSSDMQQGGDFGFDIKAQKGVLAVSSKRASVNGLSWAGFVEVFTKQNNTWDNDPAVITPQNIGPLFQFGSALDLEKSPEGTYYLAVGSVGESSGSVTNPNDTTALQAGAGYVFESTDNGLSWNQVAYLKNPDVAPGQQFGGAAINLGPCGESCTTSAIFDGQGKAITYRRKTDGTWTTEY